MKIKNFFIDCAKGAAIGIAMIIPGVSGGTLAVLLKIYDKLINAFSNLFRDFKNSVLTLLPILLGVVIAFAAAYYPLKFALKNAPFPTVMLFAGLMIGSCPKIVKDGIKNGFKKLDAIAILIPLAIVVGVCFIPNLGTADLSKDMPVYGYFLLLFIGAIASCALVVPGISGSLLLLILGYYNAIMVDTISGLKTDFGHSFLVLATFAVGLIIGFFTIAKIMKLLLTRFPRVTNWAIIGFVIGSIPAIFITFNHNFEEYGFRYDVLSTAHIAVGCVLCVIGIAATFALTYYVERKMKSLPAEPLQEETAPEQQISENENKPL